MAAGHQHHLEFGGSPVGTEFDGAIQFRLVDRIPHISVSDDFTPKTARQIRYHLVATVGPERPFYHRHQYVVLDVRMIGNWEQGAGETPAFLGCAPHAAVTSRPGTLSSQPFALSPQPSALSANYSAPRGSFSPPYR